MKLVCEELDKESSDDTENIKKERFQNILDLMLKVNINIFISWMIYIY